MGEFSTIMGYEAVTAVDVLVLMLAQPGTAKLGAQHSSLKLLHVSKWGESKKMVSTRELPHVGGT